MNANSGISQARATKQGEKSEESHQCAKGQNLQAPARMPRRAAVADTKSAIFTMVRREERKEKWKERPDLLKYVWCLVQSGHCDLDASDASASRVRRAMSLSAVVQGR